MGSVNKILLIGNLGRDCEFKFTPSGTPVAKFSVATSETWNDKSGARQEQTEWTRVALWGKPAEALHEYLKKGKQVYVEGRLQTRDWLDKDGIKRFMTEVRCDRIVLLSNGSGHSSGPTRPDVLEDSGTVLHGVPEESEIPF